MSGIPEPMQSSSRPAPGRRRAADGGAQEVAALVVSKADPETLAEAARARLSSFKVPTLWLVVPSPDTVPMSATGKVDKSALQQLLRSRGVRLTSR